ncbi:MAG: AAA family ATPase [Bacteroidota bacterium]
MTIKSIKIENLFGIFSYNISFKKNSNILIITGPNGFGKTKVLNIIDNLFNRRFIYFKQLSFKKIIVTLEDNVQITIDKPESDEPIFHFFEHNKLIETIKKSSDFDFEKSIQEYLPIRKISDSIWIDTMSNETYGSKGDLIDYYIDKLPDEISSNMYVVKSERSIEIIDSINVHLIKEQRLWTKARKSDRMRDKSISNIMVGTIETYSKELKQRISELTKKSYTQSQELDSSYPKRLIHEKNILNKLEYEARYKTLTLKQDKLKKFGLYEGKQEFLEYSISDAKALSVYLKDSELKLEVFDDLLNKLELFSDILNHRRFTFKTIQIDNLKGFYFKTVNDLDLELKQLSSGEQHEVVLLYELIFNLKDDVLILIDEPEISLHITWQKDFLNDLIKILGRNDIQVIIATHSPSIINDRWDLVHNLEPINFSK